MLLRVAVMYILFTTVAVALHSNTFAVWELKEQLQMLYINMWELLTQLEHVTADQRRVVYAEIQHIRSEIQRVIDLITQHDLREHP